MDLALRNGILIDGTGRPGYRGDLGIEDGRIIAVGEVPGRAAREIDVGGAAIAPGFIDVHTHYDAQAFWDPLLSPSVFHGVTSVIAGNCGFTLAPLSGRSEDTDYLLRMLSRVEGMPLRTLRAALKPDWTSFGQFLDRLDGKLAINAAFLVGHSALRRTVMGERAVGHGANELELESMCALLARSLADGGVGFSTTVSVSHSDYEGKPVPSRWASRSEILRLAGVLRDFPGTWLEMVTGKTEMTEAEYQLMSDAALAANRPLNWNLVMVSSRSPAEFRSQLVASDYAAQRGALVFGLVPAVPPKVILNFISGFVLDIIPGWSEILFQAHEQKLRSLSDPGVRNRLREGAQQLAIPTLRSFFADWGAQTIESANLPQNQPWIGRTIEDYAEHAGKDPLEALFDLAVMENLRFSFSPPPDGQDERSWAMRAEAWRDQRLIVGGSDAGAHLDMVNTFALTTQLLGEGVRDRGLLPLEEAVKLITSVPAERFGLINRGRLCAGMAGDVVVFEADKIGCGPVKMRFDLPEGESRLYADAEGIRHVIVNGVPVVRGNEPTGAIGGRILRSGRDTKTVHFSDMYPSRPQLQVAG